jgi:asparagine synthetase B (glutamine-hydrolysing)
MVARDVQIYNYRELRAELVREHGTSFATNGDIEVPPRSCTTGAGWPA